MHFLSECQVGYLHGDDLHFVVPSGNIVADFVHQQLKLVSPALESVPEEAEYSENYLSKER